mmetsp:Transcript_13804/g.19703  ORF Transcript_13804/g.19703 Transcript_13804/m.19703 type:complete len:81 (+) Transcript_13804:192-434(+)
MPAADMTGFWSLFRRHSFIGPNFVVMFRRGGFPFVDDPMCCFTFASARRQARATRCVHVYAPFAPGVQPTACELRARVSC